MSLRVTHDQNPAKGNDARGSTKEVTLETGLICSVPIFIKIHDVIKIDTRTMQYISKDNG